MLFSPKNKRFDSESITISIDNNTIEKVDKTKFLGVIIDSKLQWKYHIQYISSKISKSIGILMKARKVFCTNTLVSLYYSFVYSYLSYCVMVWGTACATHLDRLVKLQNKSIRIITFSGYLDHTAPLFSKLKLLTIAQFLQYQQCIFMYKYTNNKLPTCFRKTLTANSYIHTYNTRNTSNYRAPLCKTKLKQNSPIYQSITTYNKIPKPLKNLGFFNRLKKLKK